MRFRSPIVIGVLEICAIAFAQWHTYLGLQTDEAKYLLNIPYPHPPLLRSVMGATAGIPGHEWIWRFIWASILIQALWLIWDMTRQCKEHERIIVMAAWCSSTAFLLGTGSIYLSGAFAVFGVILLWLRTRPALCDRHIWIIAMGWMACVFSVFQGLLLAPLMVDVLRRAGLDVRRALIVTALPIVLLGLYVAGSPLVIATLLIHGEQGAADGTVLTRLGGTLWLWMMGGGLIGSIMGTYGIIRSKDYALMTCAALVLLYTTLSLPFPFYALLWTPLFMEGVHIALKHHRLPHHAPILPVMVLSSLILVGLRLPSPERTAEETMRTLHVKPCDATDACEPILIAGNFGHQWQYYAPRPVQRYRADAAAHASAIICLGPCQPMFITAGWKHVEASPVEAWVRR
jgi:hypothetical protein